MIAFGSFYLVSWVAALVGACVVEAMRLHAERGVPKWVDITSFVMVSWVSAPFLPLIGLVLVGARLARGQNRALLLDARNISSEAA